MDYERISQDEVKLALRKTRRNKSVGPDQIPIEAWRCLGDVGVRWLTGLFNKTFRSSKMSMEWRLSETIPIYKNNGGCSMLRDTYEGAKSCVRTPVGNTEVFPIEVGLHQGSALSPFLFALILDGLSRGTQECIPWCLIFADDIVLVSDSKEELNRRLEQWRVAL
ncbi:uncharacterized protein [Rutidosis leptorrhynchoides]|uniref:uncharacterized protein n=1 Tax=Rutidosis leptorrhynchoides TaxID=125765 RepID=UPI003A995565